MTAQIITTIAGTSVSGFSGDGGPATTAQLSQPYGIVADLSGNIYFTEEGNNVVRKINSSGIISTIAGTGIAGFGGDGGPATAALLNMPIGMTIDASGNLYVCDSRNSRVRKISTSGIITTAAGNGSSIHSGDGGAATAAGFTNLFDLTVDVLGNVYIAEQLYIRKVDPLGIITTVVGNGSSLLEGASAVLSQINYPYGVIADNIGNIYFTLGSRNKVMKVNSAGIISTFAGNGSSGYSGDGGPATTAEFYTPYGLHMNGSGDMYVSDYFNGAIRKISNTGIISTYAGTGILGYDGDGGPAIIAKVNNCSDVFLTSTGDLLIADTHNNVIRKVKPTIPASVNIASIPVFDLYPNPTNSHLRINSKDQISSVIISDVAGRIVYKNEYNSHEVAIDISELSTGIYCVNINNIEIKTFVKNN